QSTGGAMRKLGHWASWAVLLLALGAAVASAAPPADQDNGDAKPAGPDPGARPRDGWNPFLTKVFGVCGGDTKKPAPKPDKDKDKDADKKSEEPAPHVSSMREIAANFRALEEAKLRRRQDACRRLREIARDTQDEALEERAIQLDQLAFEVY